MVGTVVSPLFLVLTSSAREQGEGATVPILQMGKQAHQFFWLESGDSSGLSDAREQPHCAQGAMRGDSFVPFLCLDPVCQWSFLPLLVGGVEAGMEVGTLFRV